MPAAPGVRHRGAGRAGDAHGPLQEIQSLLLGWKGPDLTSYGELVLEGTFRVQRARHERAVFLFDKTLLITKRRGDHYVYKSHIPVRAGWVPGIGVTDGCQGQGTRMDAGDKGDWWVLGMENLGSDGGNW